MKTLERILVCLFSPYLMFFIKKYFPTKFDNYLAVHKEPEHMGSSHLPFRMDSFT